MGVGELVLAGIAVGSVLITWGITVGLFYAHVGECNRFRVDIVSRLERIEANQQERTTAATK